MIYTVHGGHAAQGNKYSGAVGYCSESVVDRAICKSVINYLQKAGHTAYDCTVDSGWSQSNIISQIKKKINSYKGVTANISIHLNAATKSAADGKVKGAETLVYSTNSNDAVIANRIVLELKVLGFTNRGVKKRTDLGILKGISNGGANILVECFFCDDQDDYNLFNKVGIDAIGKAIAMGVLGKAIPETITQAAKPTIRSGSSGTEAKRLQENLNQVASAGLVCDGKFGPRSVAALKKWQAAAGLTADGVYGPASYKRMQQLI